MEFKRVIVLALPLGLLVSLPALDAAPQNPPLTKIDLAAGKTIFEDHCSVCHGMDGSGGRGPSLHHAHLKDASDEKELRELIVNGIPPAMPSAWYLKDEEVANVAAYVKTLGNIPPEKVPGDPKQGARIYAASGCANCHILAGHGNGFGPELTEVGSRRGAAVLAQTVLHPDQTLPVEFLMFDAVLPTSETLRGVRVNEDSFTIQLRDQSGHTHSLRKSELKELRKLTGQTPMPSYDGMLSSDEVQDLVAFLAAQRGEE